MASPATMEVTRIAALASENRVSCALLVNPFTRTQVYRGTLRREMGARPLRAPPISSWPSSRPNAPPCRSLGAQCQSLHVTLRIGELEEGPAIASTTRPPGCWATPSRSTFSSCGRAKGDLYVEAVLHVPCRYLHEDGDRAMCRAHGFEGATPRGPRREPQPLQLGGDRFVVVEDCQNAVRELRPPARTLPVLGDATAGQNPCATAPCRTADNTRKAACCRDLQVEIMCTRRPSAGSSRWCARAARRISARSSGLATTRSRSR